MFRRDRYTLLPPLLLMTVAVLSCASSGGAALHSGGETLPRYWRLELELRDVGKIETIVELEKDGDGFEAHSHSGAASEFLGWFKLVLAKLFTDQFNNGALIHLYEGKVLADDAGRRVTARLTSALGPMRIDAPLIGGRFEGVLRQGNRPVGLVRGYPVDSITPLRDYRLLIDSAITIAEQHLFDPSIVQSGKWQTFVEHMRQTSTVAVDDIDIVFGFYQFAGELPFSHFALYRPPSVALDSLLDTPGRTASNLSLRTLSDSVMLLEIRSFSGGAAEIDSAFGLIAARGPHRLIIDLRGNVGGNLSAMRVAAHLIDTPRAGGSFVTRRWFVQNQAPPIADQTATFPVISDANVDLLLDGIHRLNGLRLQIVPSVRPFTGRVIVLTDRKTASAAEPLVEGLKSSGRATIVGEPTAGAMLNGEDFHLAGGWQLVIPTADYYTPDGRSLDGVGVAPDVATDSKDALAVALGLVLSPVAATK